MTMTYKALQTELKAFRAQGLTQIKLNATKDLLQAEYDRLTVAPEVTPETTEVNPTTDNEIITDTSEIVITETLTITYHSFRDIIRQRKPLHTFRKAHGFKPEKREKRYDQLTVDEWREDTLAFLDDYIIYDECDYMAA
jgi:hypothetical protein